MQRKIGEQDCEDKVDVIFCEREAEPVYRFAVLASLKANRTRFLDDKVRRDFLTFPLDLGITIETPKFQGLRVYEELGVPVVHLPMDIASGIRVWEAATEIVREALLEGEKNRFLQFFRRFWSTTDKRYSWVEFLANRLQADIGDVVQEIRQTLHQTPGERIVPRPGYSWG